MVSILTRLRNVIGTMFHDMKCSVGCCSSTVNVSVPTVPAICSECSKKSNTSNDSHKAN